MHLRRDLIAQRDDAAHFVHHLLGCLEHIRHRMRGAGGNRHGDLVHARFHGRLRAAQIGHQRHHRQTGVGEGVSHHGGGVGHLRQQLGRDEGAHLDLLQPGSGQRVDPSQLVCRGHGAVHGLQSVARADFADQNVISMRCLHLACGSIR
ncbi:hypothetical protein SDC9_196754 [bioreactor metagenome]|uniref:Uncharacterized protein n=1 Tax=bioreactor metagenome TaxID=1076179 RepID=A0A645ICR3_9ZZZZ